MINYPVLFVKIWRMKKMYKREILALEINFKWLNKVNVFLISKDYSMKFSRKNSKKYLIQPLDPKQSSSYQRILWATCIVFIIFLCVGIGLVIYYHGLQSGPTLGSANTKISSLIPMTQVGNQATISKTHSELWF